VLPQADASFSNYAGSELTIAAGASFTNYGSFNQDGTVNVEGVFTENDSFGNNGTVNVGKTGTVNLEHSMNNGYNETTSAVLNNHGTVTFLADDRAALFNYGTVDNYRRMNFGDVGTITNEGQGVFNNHTGGTVTGDVDNSASITNVED